MTLNKQTDGLHSVEVPSENERLGGNSHFLDVVKLKSFCFLFANLCLGDFKSVLQKFQKKNCKLYKTLQNIV